jgi:hypothetical protein
LCNVLKANLLIKKKAVFLDVAPCRCGVNQRFGGTYRLHLQGRRKNKKSTSKETVRAGASTKPNLSEYAAVLSRGYSYVILQKRCGDIIII